MSCGKPLNCLAARVQQENSGCYVEESWSLSNSFSDEYVGAPLPGQSSRQFWVIQFKLLDGQMARVGWYSRCTQGEASTLDLIKTLNGLDSPHIGPPAQERAPQRAATPENPQIASATPQDPTADNLDIDRERFNHFTHMKFAVMKIPDPITVPITKDVAPTGEELFSQSAKCAAALR